MKRAAQSRDVRGRRHPAIAPAIPIALLVIAQVLLPSLGVGHAHAPEGVPSGAHPADRPAVHAHGHGLPHDHLPPSTDPEPTDTGFRRFGEPTAAVRTTAIDWLASRQEAATPPGTSSGGSSQAATLVGTFVSVRNVQGSDRSLGPPPEPTARSQPCAWLTGTHPLRGPPFSA